MKNELDIICEKYGGPIQTINRGKGGINTGGDTSLLGYTKIYFEQFKKYKNQPINFLEIGIFQGKGLAMWSEFFPKGKIYGADINITEFNLNRGKFNPLENAFFNNNLIEVFQTNSCEFDKNVLDSLPLLDIIIDDGAHDHKSQYSTFLNYFPKMNKKGIYVIEDIRHFDQLSLSLKDNPYLKDIENIENFSFPTHSSKLILIHKK